MFFARLTFTLAAISAASALPVWTPEQLQHSGDINRRADAMYVNDDLDQLSNNGTASVILSPDEGGVPTISIGGNATIIPQDGSEKTVLAHFMIGNAFSYTKDLWKTDIKMAQEGGIDGFALNLGSDDWQPARLDDAYTAAKELNTDFKLCISFDMAVLPGNSASDAANIKQYITKYAGHPNQLLVDGKVFASTFSGEKSTFGHPTPQEGWTAEFKKPLEQAGTPVHFVPALFVAPGAISGDWANTVDGLLTWNSAWPTDLTSQSQNVAGVVGALAAPVLGQVKDAVGSIDADTQFIDAVKSAASAVAGSGSKTYMAGVSPFFFTHYGADTFNKNWLYVSDDHLYTSRWSTLIANRDKVDMVEIITWNDYGESSYIGSIGKDQPKSNAWVDGFDHTALIPLTKYYTTAFKTGRFPTIEKDSVVLSARPHAKAAEASADGVGKPLNWELVQDKLWADFLLSGPATVTLATSEGTTQSWDVAAAGPGRFSLPLTVGGFISATVTRDSKTVLTCRPEEYAFTDTPETYNFNSFVAGCVAE
ncbi:hypothetical protein FRB90_001995 [Tulasnella sp. 427]|nr:hypothetical protein FRB90_001995 [Tulasnella sp. 427]